MIDNLNNTREKIFRIFVNTKSNGVLYAGDSVVIYSLFTIFLFMFLVLFFLIDIRAEEENFNNLFSRFGAILILYSFITTLASFHVWTSQQTLKERKKQALKHKLKLLGKVQIFGQIKLISRNQVFLFYKEVCNSHKEIVRQYEQYQILEDMEFKVKFTRLEILLVISGTLIWAYGDLLVTLFR